MNKDVVFITWQKKPNLIFSLPSILVNIKSIYIQIYTQVSVHADFDTKIKSPLWRKDFEKA